MIVEQSCVMCGGTRWRVSGFRWFVECVACRHMTGPEFEIEPVEQQLEYRTLDFLEESLASVASVAEEAVPAVP